MTDFFSSLILFVASEGKKSEVLLLDGIARIFGLPAAAKDLLSNAFIYVSRSDDEMDRHMADLTLKMVFRDSYAKTGDDSFELSSPRAKFDFRYVRAEDGLMEWTVTLHFEGEAPTLTWKQ